MHLTQIFVFMWGEKESEQWWDQRRPGGGDEAMSACEGIKLTISIRWWNK